MKTLAQLCPKPTAEIHWLPEHLAYCRKTIPTHFVQVRGGPCYFGWQESCYTNRDLHRPVCSPRGRRPIHPVDKAHCFGVWENLGEHHHRFKKLSSRRLRKALKRELEKEVDNIQQPSDALNALVCELNDKQWSARSLSIMYYNNLDIAFQIDRSYSIDLEGEVMRIIQHPFNAVFDEEHIF